MLCLWLAFVKYLYSTCCTKFVLRFQLALIKCTGMVRTKLMLRLWLAFVKCSTQKKADGFCDPHHRSHQLTKRFKFPSGELHSLYFKK